MAMRRQIIREAYGMDGSLLAMSPLPIVAQRAPTTQDFAEVGTTWVDEPNDAVYVLTSIRSNSATWSTSPASGVGTFTSVTVNPGDITVTAGNIDITAGDLNLAAGNATIAGDLSVAGVLTFTGDLDLSSAALIDLTSTLNAAPSIYLHANGGTSEQIRIHADQGTAVNAIELDSDVGGITLVSGLASADAINLSATAGGVDIDGALQVNIASSQNAASALVLSASAGGIDMTAAGAAGEDIDIVNTAGSINLNSGEVIADSMVLTSAGGLDVTVAGTGGLDIDMVNSAGSINISAGQAVADAIVINASDAAGGVQVQAGSNGILIGNQADCAVIDIGDVVPTAARTITVGGGAVATAIADTIDIGPDGATTDAGASKVVNINTGALDTGTLTTNIGSGAAASGTHAVNVSTGAGTKTVNLGNADGLTTLNIDATTLINDSVNANTSINTGSSTGTVDIGNAAAGQVSLTSGAAIVGAAVGISWDASAASQFTVTGASVDLTLSSTGGSVIIQADEAVADAIVINASDTAGGIDLITGGGEITISSAGSVTMVPSTASVASPTAGSTQNFNVITTTFTGFTTAMGASQDFTITSSAILATSGIFVQVTNLDASTNGALMTMDGVTQAAGSIVISTTNNGAGALGAGDNVIITVWIIS